MKIRVLCIDDEQTFLELEKERLGHDGRFDVTGVGSSEEALKALETGQHDVIVSDYKMPGADGLELLKTVRAKWGSIPFILFTGRGREEIAMRALNDGADFYLPKSGEPELVFGELVNMIVQSHRRWSSERDRDEALRRFQRYADSSKDLLYRMRIKPSVSMEYFSPALKDMVGYTPQEFYDDPDLVFKCLHPDDLAKFDFEVQNPRKPDKPVIFRWFHKNGSVVYAEDTWVPVVDDSGEVVAVDGMSRVVTDRVIAEEGLRQANRKLELISSLIRHDALNRLTSILGGIDIVRRTAPSELALKALSRMEIDARLIVRQLQFSSDYQQNVSGQPKWISVADVVGKVAASWNRPDVTFDIKLDGLEVLSDYVLERVFSNLVEDSLTHGEHVTRIGSSFVPSRSGIDVVYEDNGVGIPANEKERIFERGFGKGTGYGLYLSREILAVSDISIKEIGEPGKGARFVISFPRDSSRVRPRSNA